MAANPSADLRVLSDHGRELLQRGLSSESHGDGGAPRLVPHVPGSGEPVTIRWDGDEQSEYMLRYWEKGQEHNPRMGVDYYYFESPDGSNGEASGRLLRGAGPHTCRLSAWGKDCSIPPGTKLMIYVRRRELGFRETMWSQGWEQVGEVIEATAEAAAGGVREAFAEQPDGRLATNEQQATRTWAVQLAESAGNAYASSKVQEMRDATHAKLDEAAQSAQRTLGGAATYAQDVASSVRDGAGSAAVLLDREDGPRQARQATRTAVRKTVVNAMSAAPQVARVGGSVAAGVAAVPSAVGQAVLTTGARAAQGALVGGQVGAGVGYVGGGVVGAAGAIANGSALAGAAVGFQVGVVSGAAYGAAAGAVGGGVAGAAGGGLVGAGGGAVVGGAVGLGCLDPGAGATVGAIAGGVPGMVVGGAIGTVGGAVAGAAVGEAIGPAVGAIAGGAIPVVGQAVAGAEAGQATGAVVGAAGGAAVGGVVGAAEGVVSGYAEITSQANQGGDAAQALADAWVNETADAAADYAGGLTYAAVDTAGSLAAATVELGGVSARSASEASARLSTYAASQEEKVREAAGALSESVTQTHATAGVTADAGFDALAKTARSTVSGLGSYYFSP